jgi:hypothetical protein
MQKGDNRMIRVVELCITRPMWLVATSGWAVVIAAHFIRRPKEFL